MRVRMLAMALAILLSACAHASEAYVIQAGGIHTLVDAEGKSLITDGDATGVFEVSENGLFAVGQADGYALYDDAGARLGAERFEMIAEIGGEPVFRKGGRYGALDRSGGVIVPAEWWQLVPNGEGAYLAIDGNPNDEQPDEVFYLHPGGTPARTGVLTANGLSALSEGRMAYMAPGGRYGYLDARGQTVIPAIWHTAGPFSGGAAIVCGANGYGAIDALGREVIAPYYRWMARGDGLIAAMTAEGSVDVYDGSGSNLMYTIEDAVGQVCVVGGCVAATVGDRTRLYDAGGACVLEASADAVYAAGSDGQIIASDGSWGDACQWLIGPDGAASSSRYQRILPLIPGRYAYLTMNGSVYFSRELSSEQTSWDYDSVRYGLLDAKGRELLPAEYLEIRPAGDDRLLLKTEDELIFADADGRALRRWPMDPGE